ncbi:DUF2794 domain-containing protein [Segnochrobactraceae bacterium EtOH-i3]
MSEREDGQPERPEAGQPEARSHPEPRLHVVPAAPVAPSGSSMPQPPPQVSFDRRELSTILNIYGRMVALGEWRDYAIDMLRDEAVFSIFRRTSEMPLYRIVKAPRLARRQGAYSVVTTTGLILKRGPDLAQVLKVLEKKAVRLVEV